MGLYSLRTGSALGTSDAVLTVPWDDVPTHPRNEGLVLGMRTRGFIGRGLSVGEEEGKVGREVENRGRATGEERVGASVGTVV